MDKNISSSVRPLVGLALGGGGARGWAHIGVIQSLRELGIEPDIVCGTSIGALVGASYVADHLDDLGDWVVQLSWPDVVGFIDISLGGGFIEGKKLFEFFRKNFEDIPIEQLSKPFAAVATRLDSGQEVWLRKGSVMQAVRASIAVPGFFTPVRHKGYWLIDGGLVNPVPVSVCRGLGADLVIAVSLHTRVPGQGLWKREDKKALRREEPQTSVSESLVDKMKHALLESATSVVNRSGPKSPSVVNVVADSIEIMQVRIMRSRMAGDPPELMITPRAVSVGFLEFHRGREAIEAGRQAVQHKRGELEELKANLQV